MDLNWEAIAAIGGLLASGAALATALIAYRTMIQATRTSFEIHFQNMRAEYQRRQTEFFISTNGIEHWYELGDETKLARIETHLLMMEMFEMGLKARGPAIYEPSLPFPLEQMLTFRAKDYFLSMHRHPAMQRLIHKASADHEAWIAQQPSALQYSEAVPLRRQSFTRTPT